MRGARDATPVKKAADIILLANLVIPALSVADLRNGHAFAEVLSVVQAHVA